MRIMQNKAPSRNGYIDVIKFIFAVIILDFHINTGLFPGGRLAVEGFFMISGYLMMKTLQKNRFPEDSLGQSTIRFLGNKFKGLLPYILPSSLLGYVIVCLLYSRGISASLKRLPLLIFDIIPLRTAGFRGEYVLGISWYLASMFIALAVLYPLCKRYADKFVLTVCPLMAVLFYGVLSHFYGHLAVGTDFIENTLVNTGVLRALGATALGCLIYEIEDRTRGKEVTLRGKILFTLLELVGVIFLLCDMHFLPKSEYDYVAVFVMFGVLTVGISGISFSSSIFGGRWTKPLGTGSFLIVLNHYLLNSYCIKLWGSGYIFTEKKWFYFAGVAASCAIVWLSAKLIIYLMNKAAKIKLFK